MFRRWIRTGCCGLWGGFDTPTRGLQDGVPESQRRNGSAAGNTGVCAVLATSTEDPAATVRTTRSGVSDGSGTVCAPAPPVEANAAISAAAATMLQKVLGRFFTRRVIFISPHRERSRSVRRFYGRARFRHIAPCVYSSGPNGRLPQHPPTGDDGAMGARKTLSVRDRRHMIGGTEAHH